MIPRAQVIFDLEALQHNFECVKKLAPHKKILAMIKSNAYGHGLLRVANALAEADGFGVANLDEAVRLRQAGVQQEIVIMPGFINAEELQVMIKLQLTPVIHQSYQADILANFTPPPAHPIKVWVKIDTGMHRLGLFPEEVKQVYECLQACSFVQKPLVLMTHLNDADCYQSLHLQQQLTDFKQAVPGLAGLTCIANSAGIVNWPQTHSDWLRPGIMLYGVSPMEGKTAADFDLKPVMSVYSRIMAVRHLQKGDAVGYGGTWRCPEAMPIGVINFGYGNGYPRHVQNGTPVLVNNVECPLIGRVSMDLITIDLRNYPQAKAGDLVTLWGRGLPIERIAASAGTIAYELLCRVGQSVKFKD